MLVILQARMSSKRLPGKVMKLLNGTPMIQRQINRIQKSKKISKVIVATSIEKEDFVISDLCQNIGIECYRGSLTNVFSRFFDLTTSNNFNNIVRLTADCPFTMPLLIDEMFSEFNESNFDYYSNSIIRTYPRGLDIEFFTAQSLLKLNQFDLSEEELEHVTIGIYRRPELFKLGNHAQSLDLSQHRWTVDTPEDFKFTQEVYNNFEGKEEEFTQEDILKFLKENPSTFNYDF